jgi:hypothetical protein
MKYSRDQWIDICFVYGSIVAVSVLYVKLAILIFS